MSSQTKRIWHVRLADSPPGAGSRNNSTRIIRTNIFEGTSNVALTASALCRKVVESSGEWLMKICQRHPVARDNNSEASSILVNYGCGYATLVLINGAELASPEHWRLNPIWASVVVASVKSEESGKRSDERVQEYGIVSADDFIYDHLSELQRECTEGVRVYLHPTLEAGVLEGSFETDHETDGHGDRKRIFRIWTESDSHAISRIERDLELENRLKEGSRPSRPAKKARVRETAAAKKMHSSKKSPVQKASAAVAKGTKKAAAPKAAATSAGRSTMDELSTKDAPMLHTENPSAASVPPKEQPVLVPPVDENPQDIELAKKSAHVAAVPKPTPNKAQGAKAASTAPSQSSAASKGIVPIINDDTETNDYKGQLAKTAEEEVSDGKTHNKLGFHPREIVLLAKAFDGELDEADLKKKVTTSTGKAAYSVKEAKAARRILGGVDKEVKEMRAASKLERSVKAISVQATEVVTKATGSEKNDREKTADQKAGQKMSDGDRSSEAPNSSPAKDKETEPISMKRKPGRPKGSKSKPKATPADGSKNDAVEEKRKPSRPKGSKSQTKATPAKEEEATKKVKVSEGGKVGEVEAAAAEDKNNDMKTVNGVETTPLKPPAASATTTAKKTPIGSTATDDETHSEPTKKRTPGPKNKTPKTPSSSSKEESKTDTKKSSERKRGRPEASSTSSSPRTRSSSKKGKKGKMVNSPIVPKHDLMK